MEIELIDKCLTTLSEYKPYWFIIVDLDRYIQIRKEVTTYITSKNGQPQEDINIQEATKTFNENVLLGTLEIGDVPVFLIKGIQPNTRILSIITNKPINLSNEALVELIEANRDSVKVIE